jgi:acyl-coenzyme A thioesterase PaaI-like protein
VSGTGSVEIIDGGFERVDHLLYEDPKFRKFVKDHALHDTLAGPGRVEQYEMYINKQREELLAVITFGKSLNGYPGVVHGGILGLLIDNSFGILFLNLNKPMSVTANLSINYRAPTYASTQVVLYAKIDRVEGRKMFMTASIWDAKSGKVLVDATTLFIAIKKPWWDPFNLLSLLRP